MTVTIDKFGRILIPVKFRKKLGLTDGSELQLFLEEDGTIMLAPIPETIAEMQIDDLGIPVFHFDTHEALDYDFNQSIKEDREVRGLSKEMQ